MFRKILKTYRILYSPNTEAERQKRRYLILKVSLKVIVLVDVGFFILTLFGSEAMVFWTVFLSFLLFGWDSRFAGALAILALTACPILLSLDFQADAEQVAVYAYYLLVMTVVLQIIEFKRHPERFVEEKVEKPKPVLDLRTQIRDLH